MHRRAVSALTKVLRAAAESVCKRTSFTAWAHLRRAAAAISTRQQLAVKRKVRFALSLAARAALSYSLPEHAVVHTLRYRLAALCLWTRMSLCCSSNPCRGMLHKPCTSLAVRVLA